MDIREHYCGVDFTIRENGVGTSRWEFDLPAKAHRPIQHSSGTVNGGQNEAILAARKAIRIYLAEVPGAGKYR
jgi:hypothetical protein